MSDADQTPELTKEQIRKERKAAYNRAWTQANRENVRIRARARYKANPEKQKVRSAAWQKANPEKANAKSAAWRKANPEKAKAVRAAWYKANREKAKAKSVAWFKANREKVRIQAMARYKANPEKAKVKIEAYKKRVKSHPDKYQKKRLRAYIARCIGISSQDVPDQLVSLTLKLNQLKKLCKSQPQPTQASSSMTSSDCSPTPSV